jgi:hypothetical protein
MPEICDDSGAGVQTMNAKMATSMVRPQLTPTIGVSRQTMDVEVFGTHDEHRLTLSTGILRSVTSSFIVRVLLGLFS